MWKKGDVGGSSVERLRQEDFTEMVPFWIVIGMVMIHHALQHPNIDEIYE